MVAFETAPNRARKKLTIVCTGVKSSTGGGSKTRTEKKALGVVQQGAGRKTKGGSHQEKEGQHGTQNLDRKTKEKTQCE